VRPACRDLPARARDRLHMAFVQFGAQRQAGLPERQPPIVEHIAPRGPLARRPDRVEICVFIRMQLRHLDHGRKTAGHQQGCGAHGDGRFPGCDPLDQPGTRKPRDHTAIGGATKTK